MLWPTKICDAIQEGSANTEPREHGLNSTRSVTHTLAMRWCLPVVPLKHLLHTLKAYRFIRKSISKLINATFCLVISCQKVTNTVVLLAVNYSAFFKCNSPHILFVHLRLIITREGRWIKANSPNWFSKSDGTLFSSSPMHRDGI